MNLESISSENINKELAYLLGVYLTDGSISSFVDKWGRWYNFSLKAIDKDFVEFTLSCIKKIIPECKATVYEQKARIRYWGNGAKPSKCQKQYCLNVGFTKFKDFFIEQTGNKHHIPLVIWDASLAIKKWFVAGLMDGDGYITKKKRASSNEKVQYQVGMGGVSEGWIYEFVKLLNKCGVNTGKEQISKDKNRKTPFTTFTIKTSDFKEKGFFFKIKRKQDRLKDFIDGRSETRRCTSYGMKV